MPSAVAKSLSRLSRDKIIDLCTTWAKSSRCEPYLTSNRDIREIDEEDYLHEPATSRPKLQRIYSTQKENSETYERWSKKDIIDRIVDGDWRRGLSYEQLASIDFAALEENDIALRWSALKLVPLRHGSSDDDVDEHQPRKRRKIDTTLQTASRKTAPQHYPHTTAAEFVRNLKTQISPLVKAHFHIHRIAAHNLSVVRLCIIPHTPFAPLSTNVPRNEKTALDGSRILFIALPDSCPYVYVSMSGGTSLDRSRRKSAGVNIGQQKVDAAATKKIVLEAIPKALSRPQQRWALQTTNLTAKSLQAMTLLRGNSKPGVMGGAFSRLGVSLQNRDQQQESPSENEGASKEDQAADSSSEHQRRIEQRFGPMMSENRAKLDRVNFRITDLLLERAHSRKRSRHVDETGRQRQYGTQTEPTPMTITLSGLDVFAGLKQLATIYPDCVDLDRLPSAFTGEGSSSVVTL